MNSESCNYKITYNNAPNENTNFFCDKNIPELYSCFGCDYRTDLLEVLRNHFHRRNPTQNDETNNHYTFRSYECRNCQFQTYSLLVITKHRTGGCDRTVAHLRGGKRRDLVKTWHKCDRCLYETRDRSKLLRHKTSKHAEDEEVTWFECGRCEARFKREERLKGHLRVKHATNEAVRHEKAKRKAKDGFDGPFKCDECPYKARRLSKVVEHSFKHSGAENERHECAQCGRRYHKKNSLVYHVKMAHASPDEVQWFGCDKCPYRSKKRSHLKLHARVHMKSEVKCFECDQCEYKSVWEKNVKAHKIARHTSDEDVKWLGCAHCGQKYKAKRDLYNHLMKKHLIVSSDQSVAI